MLELHEDIATLDRGIRIEPDGCRPGACEELHRKSHLTVADASADRRGALHRTRLEQCDIRVRCGTRVQRVQRHRLVDTAEVRIGRREQGDEACIDQISE